MIETVLTAFFLVISAVFILGFFGLVIVILLAVLLPVVAQVFVAFFACVWSYRLVVWSLSTSENGTQSSEVSS